MPNVHRMGKNIRFPGSQNKSTSDLFNSSVSSKALNEAAVHLWLIISHTSRTTDTEIISTGIY